MARRLALSFVTLLLITVAVYAAIRSIPGLPTAGDEPGDGAAGRAAGWPGGAHALDPAPIGYLRWLAGLARGDLGTSLSVQPGAPVTSLIARALPFTLALGASAFTLTIALALPFGLLSAWRRGSAGSRAATALLYGLHALPAFWIALALQDVVAGRLGALPPLGPGPQGSPAGLLTALPYWVLPTVAITLGSLAFVIRFSRAAVLEAVMEPFAVAARARGAGEGRVLCRHALAAGSVPLVSLAGLMLPGIVSGSVMIETIFALPGVGRLLFLAASRRDYPVIMALSLLTAVATLAANLLADALYRVADPRLRTARDGDRA